eukprot:m.75133 g.75133  ORF g.75133 m.75133 type:complete len:90 (-) comp12434_c0_seq4:1373-1642(-)
MVQGAHTLMDGNLTLCGCSSHLALINHPLLTFHEKLRTDVPDMLVCFVYVAGTLHKNLREVIVAILMGNKCRALPLFITDALQTPKPQR